jgi:hypothetical protein
MRTSSRGRTRREGGFILLDAILAALILLIGIGATMLTIRGLLAVSVRQAERSEQLVAQRNRNAQLAITFAREE